MKILHTADIHLRQTGDSRWEALEHLIQTARDHSVALLVISGDLFDRKIDVPGLKGPLRDLFQQEKVEVVILPGNHDVHAIDEGDYFGDNVTVLGRSDRFCDIGKVRLFGLPFEKIDGEKIIEKLLWIRQNTRTDAANILLYHGELLDMVYARDGFGDEDVTTYMPVRLSYFDGLGLDYVLAGHFHTTFDVRKYRNGYFVYPGSPVSITRKETGARKANLFEVGGQPMPIELGTAYFDDVVVRLNPMSREDPIEEIEKRIGSCGKKARIVLEVTGFVDFTSLGKDESEFAKQIGALITARGVEYVSHQWNDVGLVLQSDLYVRCMQGLDAKELDDDQKERVKEMIMESMMESQDAY
jgi:predicted phosphodiesterase